jgi:magnesium-transporting ATPase (P-type)
MGKLGLILQEVISGETPLTKSLDTLGQQLSLLVIVLCVVFALIGILKNASIERMLETSIASSRCRHTRRPACDCHIWH